MLLNSTCLSHSIRLSGVVHWRVCDADGEKSAATEAHPLARTAREPEWNVLKGLQDQQCLRGKTTIGPPLRHNVSGVLIFPSRLQYLENRVRELEARGEIGPSANIRAQPTQWRQEQHHSHVSPTQVSQQDIHSIGPTRAIHLTDVQSPLSRTAQRDDTSGASPAVSSSSRITRDQPLAHEVGLLSLTNASDPKYLGPSSGVTFARLIYESVPQSQGLPLAYSRQNDQDQGLNDPGQGPVLCEALQVDLPSMAECQQYAEMYFAASAFYPFISQDVFYTLLGEVFRLSKTSAWESRLPVKLALAQVFLVLSLGARFLEIKLSGTFGSRELFATGMSYGTQIKLHDSIEGVQILLLLVQHSFYSPEGLNAWYLLHTILASCLDLGLQRRDNSELLVSLSKFYAGTNLSCIFWARHR